VSFGYNHFVKRKKISVVSFLSGKKLTYLLLVLTGAFILFSPPADPDFGWHYKYGEYLFQNGKILRENIFSYTNTDYKWANSYWISELIMYMSYRFLGNVTSSLILSFTLSLIFLLIIKRHTDDTLIVSLIHMSSMIVLRAFYTTVRPLCYSTIFLFLLVHVLLQKKHLKLVPFIFLVWANMHADFVIGLFILGIYCLSDFFKKTNAPELKFKQVFPTGKRFIGIKAYLEDFLLYLKKIFGEKQTIKKFTQSFGIFFISVLFTLINPFGVSLWFTLLKELTQPTKAFVSEWQSLTKINPINIFLSTFTAAGLISTLLQKNVRREKYGSWYVFLIIFFYLFSIKSVYFVRIMIIASLFPIIDETVDLKSQICNSYKKQLSNIPKCFGNALLGLILLTTASDFFTKISVASDDKLWTEKKYPYGAVTYLKENSINGNVLNCYGWGGYMIWKLPEYKTFIDGRMTAWRKNGNYFMDDYQKIYYQTEENVDLLEEYLKKYDIGIVMEKPDSNLVKYLRENRSEEWETVYEDDVSVILKKK